jgi:hypothetical protein
MEKTSKVIQVAGNGHYDSQYGRMYKFDISFENGDSGQYLSKMESQTKFVLQQEATYTIEAKDFNGRTYHTIKPVTQQAQQFNGGGAKFQKDPETDKRITRMSVLKVAGDLAIADKIKVHAITNVAQILERYVLTGEDTISSIYAQAQPPKKQGNIEQNFVEESIKQMELEQDDLPF